MHHIAPARLPSAVARFAALPLADARPLSLASGLVAFDCSGHQKSSCACGHMLVVCLVAPCPVLSAT
jgi:hypothetical protein